MMKFTSCLMVILIASSSMASQSTKPITNDELVKNLIQNKAELASLIEEYGKQKEVIDGLEKSLETIKKESSDSLAIIASMQRTIDELKDRNEMLKDIIMASMDTDKQQVLEFQKRIDAEVKRGNKKLLIGGGIGFILGVILFAVAR